MSLIPYLFDNDWTQQSGVELDAFAASQNGLTPVTNRRSESQLQEQCGKLEGHIGQLNLVVEALVRMAISNGTIKPKELAELMHTIDQEDGQQDGQYHNNQHQAPEWCPECEARVPSGKTHCVFCGLRFEDGIDRIRQLDRPKEAFEHIPEWCPDCEARIPYGNTSCTFCGREFPASHRQSEFGCHRGTAALEKADC